MLNINLIFRTKPCRTCGSINRYKNGSCINCKRAGVKRYQQTPKGQEVHKQTRIVYRKTAQGRESLRKSQLKWAESSKGKAFYVRFEKSPGRRANKNKRRQERKITDIPYWLSERVRDRLQKALKGNYKTGSAVRDLGCTISELKIYLESKFQPGMVWDNWTTDGWHIDHIVPLVSFDLTNREELLKAVHYTNLQPLWAKDNLSKGDTFGPR
jgi:hypothetical protein